MPEHKKRDGQCVPKGWKLLAGLALAVALLICLDGLANWDRVTDPTEETGVEEKDLYRPEGWSEEIVIKNQAVIQYADRTRQRFLSTNQEQMEQMRRAWENFSRLLPEDVPRHVVPIPPPVIFEAGCEADTGVYREFLGELQAGLGGEVIDLSDALAERSGEYIYYPEQNSLTNRGAYYTAAQLLNVLEGASLPPLEDYDEELYYSPGNELTYLYSLPGSRGYCEQFTVQDDGGITSVKKSVIRKHQVGHGSVIGASGRHWAVMEGDGEEETGTLLLIGDSSGKVLAPFLANHYRRVYYVNLEKDRWFGTEFHPIEEIFQEYNVKRVLYAQWAPHMGSRAWGTAFSGFMGQEGGEADGKAVG